MINLFDELTSVTRALDAAEIDRALVGGLAVSFWAEPRATTDIDFLISPGDWPSVIDALKPLGYLAIAAPMDFGNIRMRRLTKVCNGDVLVIDFLFADEKFAADLVESVEGDYNGLKLRIAQRKSGTSESVIPGDEFTRRVRRISQMRELIIGMKRSLREAHARGEVKELATLDIRIDADYWQRLMDEQSRRESQESSPGTD